MVPPRIRNMSTLQACLRPRDRFWDIPVPKIDSALTTYWCPSRPGHQALRNNFARSLLLRTWLPMTGRRVRRPTLCQGTPGKQCCLTATGDYRWQRMICLSCREIARQAECSREIVSRSIQYLVERHLLKRDGHALLVLGLRLEQEPGTNGKLQLSWPKTFRDSCKALYHSNRRQSIKRHQRVKAAPGRRSRGHAHACC